MNIVYIGILGMFLLLSGFFLSLFNIISQNSKNYVLLNILGSGLMIYYSILLKSIPFLILNIV